MRKHEDAMNEELNHIFSSGISPSDFLYQIKKILKPKIEEKGNIDSWLQT